MARYDSYDEAMRRSRARKRRARAMKIQREKIIKRRILLAGAVLLVVLLAVIIVNFVSGIRKERDNNIEAAADGVLQAESDAQDEDETEPQTTTELVHPSLSEDYIDLTDVSGIASERAALIDVDNNTVIAGKLPNEKMYPASMTKVMTLIVVCEHIDDIPDSYTFSYEMLNKLYLEDASVAGFLEGEVVDTTDLLYGLILPSGADAAEALAEMVAGSNEEFAKLMNEKCEELGLKNTSFANPTGLYDDNQYTTPVEMAMIMEYAMENELCAKVLGTYQYTTKPTQQHPEGILLTSTIYSRVYGDEAEGVEVKGGKTGYIYEAGNCLVTYAVTNTGHAYVFCTGGASYRWAPVYDEIYAYTNLIPASEKTGTESASQSDSSTSN